MQYIKYLLAGLLLLIPSTSLADTHAASGCSKAEINSAITAAADGDTVTVPPGSCEWLVTDNITIPSAKKITLQGSGVGVTTITGVYTSSSARSYISVGTSKSRITGFSFINVTLLFGGVDFRIDHNSFYGETPGLYTIETDANAGVAYEIPAGLIDNNTFTNGRIITGGPTLNNTDWTLATNLGSADAAVYVEDNTFTRVATITGNAIDSNYGGAYVFRYNTVNGNYIEAHSVQGVNRAAKRWEIYGNTINRNGITTWGRAFHLRGGTGITAYNNIDDTWNYYLELDNKRCYESATTYGLCDGSHTGLDGNTGEGVEAGYPCRDQIGRGPDTELWVSPSGTYTQPLEPAYFWMNFNDSGAINPVVTNSSGNHIQNNRDYYTTASSFDGTSGVGCGTLANRPACESGCTVGVAYWATDQSCESVSGMVGDHPTTPLSGTLYKLTGAGTWTEVWTPAAYPHELNEDSGGDTTAPTLISATIAANGTSLSLVFNEAVTVNTNTGFVLTATGSPSLTYASGTGTATLVYTIGAAVAQSESGITLAYTTGADYIEDAAGNDLDSFSDASVTNNSTQNTPPTVELTVTKTGTGCTITSAPSGVNCGSTCTVSVDNGTVVTLSGWSENGWNAITYGGDCAANGTVTMNAAKECTATCTQVYLFP